MRIKLKDLHILEWGQKGWIYSVNGCSPTLPATQYKDPTKIIISVRKD